MASHINDGLKLDISFVDNISRQSHFKPQAPLVFFWLQNYRWLRGPHCSLASGAFPLPMPWLFAKDTSITILPPVPLLSIQDTLALYGYPWALWSARTRLAQKGQPPDWLSLSRQSHCNHLGLLHISLGVFSLFGHITIVENWISQLEQIVHWSLRASSCSLNFVPMSGADWTMKCVAKRACPSGDRRNLHLCTC